MGDDHVDLGLVHHTLCLLNRPNLGQHQRRVRAVSYQSDDLVTRGSKNLDEFWLLLLDRVDDQRIAPRPSLEAMVGEKTQAEGSARRGLPSEGPDLLVEFREGSAGISLVPLLRCSPKQRHRDRSERSRSRRRCGETPSRHGCHWSPKDWEQRHRGRASPSSSDKVGKPCLDPHSPRPRPLSTLFPPALPEEPGSSISPPRSGDPDQKNLRQNWGAPPLSPRRGCPSSIIARSSSPDVSPLAQAWRAHAPRQRR